MAQLRKQMSMVDADARSPTHRELPLDVVIYPIHSLWDFGFESWKIKNSKMIGVDDGNDEDYENEATT